MTLLEVGLATSRLSSDIRDMSSTDATAITQLSWLSRHWKWFVPSLLVGFVAIVALVTIYAVRSGIKTVTESAPVQMAYSIATNDPRVQERLGNPLSKEGFPNGSLKESGSEGIARLQVPLAGSKSSGTLHVLAHKSADRWKIGMLRLDVHDNGSPIDLRPNIVEELSAKTPKALSPQSFAEKNPNAMKVRNRILRLHRERKLKEASQQK